MSAREKGQNARDAARFAAALEPLQALLKDPPLMTPRCVAALEEAIRELEWTRASCVRADVFLADCAAMEAEEQSP